MIRSLIRWTDTCSRWGGYLSAASMLVIVLLISVEIFLRTLLRTSTLVADEYSGYLMVAVVFFGLAWTLGSDGHIRIGLLTSRLPDRWQKGFDLLVHLFALAFCLYFLWYTGLMVKDTRALDMRADSIAETPLWIPQLAMLAGLILLTLQIFAEILRRLLSSPTR